MGLFSSLFGIIKRVEKQHSLNIEDGMVVFNGGAKYTSLPLEKIKSISYQPRNDSWQEIKFNIEDRGVLNYYFNNSPENLQSAVNDIIQGLKPSQPICQFIMSAKQGSLSGKD